MTCISVPDNRKRPKAFAFFNIFNCKFQNQCIIALSPNYDISQVIIKFSAYAQISKYGILLITHSLTQPFFVQSE